jgi:4-amino-4-deoxy-L-arabinose transferase-like glycosyltransferase
MWTCADVLANVLGEAAMIDVRARVRAGLRDPLFWIACVMGVLGAVGIDWGLPASDGWDNDGVAPRDFLAGLLQTYTPGRYFTYPPFHLLLLALLSAPVTVTALLRAPSLEAQDVVQEIIQVPYMTGIAFIARLVSLAFAIGIVLAVAKMAEELAGRRAGWFAGGMAAVNASLTYYAHTTNLDVPYLFWGALALLGLTRALARREPERLVAAAVMAVLAIATKDQAYALFLLSAPIALLLWFGVDAWPRAHAKRVAKALGRALLVAVALFLLVDAVVFNPSGFRARVRFLLGSASQDFAHYSNDWLGRSYVIRDSLGHFDRYYPVAFAIFVVLGIVLVVVRSRKDRARLVASLVPLLAAVSFTLMFNCTARRTEHRFLLPQMVLWAVYGGIAIEAVVFAGRAAWQRAAAGAVALALYALALFECATVDANLVKDPRYEAEAWMAAHVAPGDTIEVHGLNVYLPRFPPQARVVRVGPEPLPSRNPLPNVVEVEDKFVNASERKHRWIVVSEGFVWRYLLNPYATEKSGRVLPPTQIESGSDPDATAFFQPLMQGRSAYRMAHVARYESAVFPRRDIHASTSREIYIFELSDPGGPSASDADSRP